jgi:hypothetical protein
MRLLLCVMLLATTLVVTAQDKPEFSGVWILMPSDSSASSAAQTLVVHQLLTRTSVRGIALDHPLITFEIERHSSGSVHSERYQIGVIGGTIIGDVETHHSTTWDGDRLVIETIYSTYSARQRNTEISSTHTEVWSLDAQGTLSVVATDQNADAKPRTSTLIYRHQP